MTEPPSKRADGRTPAGAFVRAEQPWIDPFLARLFDVFPFEADLPFYRGLAAAQGGRVLEVACGTGRVLVPLVEAGYWVVGLDASPYMLARAREKLARLPGAAGDRGRLVQGDMRSFDLGERFDLALIPTKSLAYLTERADQLAALRGVAAHLRPGGLFVLDLLHPTPRWLDRPPGSLRQDLAQHEPASGATYLRTETVVQTDLAAQVRWTRSAYEVVDAAGAVTKRIVEWPYRYLHRFEAEHLLERAGFTVEALYGGYRGEPFMSESPDMVFLARR